MSVLNKWFASDVHNKPFDLRQEMVIDGKEEDIHRETLRPAGKPSPRGTRERCRGVLLLPPPPRNLRKNGSKGSAALFLPPLVKKATLIILRGSKLISFVAISTCSDSLKTVPEPSPLDPIPPSPRTGFRFSRKKIKGFSFY